MTPARPICGVVAVCTRGRDHRGQHGGFREAGRMRAVKLTPAEATVLLALIDGATQEKGAHRLGIATKTLKNHLTAIYAKLGVQSLVEAYYRIGWLQVDAAGRDL